MTKCVHIPTLVDIRGCRHKKNAVRRRLSKHSFVARRLTFITDDILRRGPLTIMFIVFIVAVVVLSARPWGHSAGGRRKA